MKKADETMQNQLAIDTYLSHHPGVDMEILKQFPISAIETVNKIDFLLTQQQLIYYLIAFAIHTTRRLLKGGDRYEQNDTQSESICQ